MSGKDKGDSSQAHPQDLSFAQRSVQQQKTTEDDPSAPKILLSLLLAVTILLAPPQQAAHAGFGPSSGATTSPPPNLTRPNVQDEDLSGKKLKILIGSSLDEKRLQEFSAQLDLVIESRKQSRASAMKTEAPDSSTVAQDDEVLPETGVDEDLEKARLLQKQIADREKLLEQLEAQPYWFNYLAAFIGSLASTLIMHPVDTIKTRLQVAKNETEETTQTSQEDGGFFTLYEGLTGNILKEGPPSALYLGVYESVKYTLQPKIAPAYLLGVYLISGAAGEMVGSVVRAPAEAIKCLVQSNAVETAFQAATRVLGTAEGRENVLRAWSASLWRDVPFGAIQLAIFELVKAYILNNPDIDFDSSTLQAEAIIGAFAGGCGAFLVRVHSWTESVFISCAIISHFYVSRLAPTQTNPTDVITTRIITQSTDKEDGKGPLGVIGMGRKIYQEEGLSAFFSGWTARVGYWSPAISIFLTCYCSVRQAGVRYDLFP